MTFDLYEQEEVQVLLEHEVRQGEKGKDGAFRVTDTSTVEAVLGDVKKYIGFYEDSGLPMINHRGILKLLHWMGGELLEPKLEDRPRGQDNNKGYAYLVTIEFPDGEKSFAGGEADDINTNIAYASGKYKQNQALIRGINKAFLRSRYVNLIDVFSEEEAEEFKNVATQRIIESYKEKEREWVLRFKEKEMKYKKMIQGMLPYLALPESHDSYPHVKLRDILFEYEDLDTAKQIMDDEEHPVLSFAMKQLSREFKTHKEEIAVEEALNESPLDVDQHASELEE
ncbi:hypothetical protein IMZ31_20620 (plasmid) [Pontibacillus sp. ALD_SL1]|uniref:hypothetical protein n=1 Tax=Pontibacillus sp. ALD_SL1 TaxID=2777185 RepID=UPI001A968834|nr:hypothetical protein [Pontibacillus sp. ALD_SL1]QST02954.1 hypothetical protein IMZ31_20620 [Pontibacillus sp. ALD_SL1]